VRALGGSIAWIDRLRDEGKRIAVQASGERAEAALELAGIADRFDLVVSGLPPKRGILHALEEFDVAPDRALLVGVDPNELEAAPTRSSPTCRSCSARPSHPVAARPSRSRRSTLAARRRAN
jgi:beta-phosphoglucomutase-like phosphatase (HAD superfamily)